MDKNLVKRLIKSLYEIGHNDSHRKINDSVRGENMVISLIDKNGGPIYPKNIEKAMGISSARVAKIINNLENKNLIIRETDKEDRRKTLVSLTKDGYEFVEVKNQQMNFAITTMFDLLGDKDSEDFVRIVEKIKTNLPQIKKIYKEKFGEVEDDKDF